MQSHQSSLLQEMPNIPGMTITKNSWALHQYEGKSFRRPKSGINRPQTANVGMLRASSTATLPPRDVDVSLIRPMTSNNTRELLSSQLVGFIRPKTAAGLSRSISEAALPGGFTFEEDKVQPAATRRMNVVPPFVENDRLVMRFYGFFHFRRLWDKHGALGYTPFPDEEPRHVTILYYLEDQTCEIIEPKLDNTGMAGGSFLKRNSVRKADGETLQLRDLAVGNVVSIYGQQFHITDADQSTRDYFRRELHVILPPVIRRPDQVPPDQGAPRATGLGQLTSKRMAGSYGARSTDFFDKKEAMEKSYRYLHFDGRVLRFVCVDAPPRDFLDDRVTVSAHAKKFVLSYFPSDSSIEMRVSRSNKSVSEQIDNWLLLKKSRLPRNWQGVQRGKPPEYFDVDDFRSGNVIEIYSRKFLVVDCDDPTKEMYRNMGIDQIPVPEYDDSGPPIVHPVPQLGDGFLPIGGPEDTLATVYGMPKVRLNERKIQRNQNRTLCCRIKMLTDAEVDRARPFELTFYLESDALQIYEAVVRNSGVVGGSYLKRGKYINSLPPNGEEPRYFKPVDFFLGNVFCINGQEFQIVEMDNMSLRFCETYCNEFPLFDTFHIIHRLARRVCIERRFDLRKEVARVVGRNGVMNKSAFIQELDSLGLSAQLNDQEVLTLMRRFKDEGGRYHMFELCDFFSHVYFAEKRHSKERQTGRAESIRVNDLASLLSSLRARSTQWRRQFRKHPLALDGKLSLKDMIDTFKLYKVGLNAEAKRLIQEKYAVSHAETEKFLLHRIDMLKNSTKAETNLHLNDFKAKSSGTNDLTGGTKGGHSRIDIRSQSRLQHSLQNEGGGGGIEDENSLLLDDYDEHSMGRGVDAASSSDDFIATSALQVAIIDRRSKIMTSVIRDHLPQPGIKYARNHGRRQSQVSPDVVIDFFALCDDIYVCDWV